MGSKIVKQVIVIRKDLKMRKGKEIAQGSHASMAFLTRRGLIQKDSFISGELSNAVEAKEWFKNGFTKICVTVNSEQELMEVYNKARLAGLVVELITDSGATEFHGVPTHTCIAIGPHFNESFKGITDDLKLY